MLTVVLYGLLAIGLMGALFLLAVRFLPSGEQIAPAVRDEPVWSLPTDRTLKAVDIEQLRLPVALRGYRFAETDELLDRIVAELHRRDEELERLYGLLIAMPVAVEPGAGEGSRPRPSADLPLEDAPTSDVLAHAPEQPAPEQPAPEQPAPEQPAPEQPAPEQPAPEQPAPEQPAPEQPAPEQPAPEQPAPEQPAPEQAAPEQAAPEQAAPEQAAPEQAAPEQAAVPPDDDGDAPTAKDGPVDGGR